MRRSDDIAYREWIADAREVTVAAELTRRGIKVLHERNGPCPACGGTDRFAVNMRENVFICRASAAGGDAIALCQHIDGSSFLEAVETLTGRPAPGQDSTETPERQEARRRAIDERARVADEQHRRHQKAQLEARQREQAQARRQFAAATGIRGTHAEAYLAARGINLLDGFGADLRFVASLPYRGYPHADASMTEPLGSFPAMVAAIRNVDGIVIGLHRTYLDPAEPKKLTPPGDRARNPARKILGAGAGTIWLTAPSSHLVMGEGIESTLSGQHLGIGGGGACYAAGISLGNIAGASMGRLPHPDDLDDPHRRLPDGVPNPDRPGVVLPEVVRTVTLLVDGDSERCLTWAHIRTAGRRFKDQGRSVVINHALPGQDHNDMLMARAR